MTPLARKTATTLACFVGSVGALNLHPVPWGALLTCVLWAALTLAFLDRSTLEKRRWLHALALLGLGVAGVCLHPYLSAALAAGWLAYLAGASDRRHSGVVRQFAYAILAFELVDLLVLRHGTVELWLNNSALRFTSLIRDGFGYGEISGSVRLDHRLLMFTVVAAAPWAGGPRSRLLLPVAQALVVVLAVPLRPYLGQQAAVAAACLSACALTYLAPPADAPPRPAPGRRARYGLFAVRAACLACFLTPLAPAGLTPRDGWADPADPAAPGRTVLFVNDRPAGEAEGGDGDITHFAPAVAATTPAAFDQARSQPRYDKLARRLLPALGYRVTVKAAQELTPDDLAQHRVVVLICLQNALPAACKEALYAAVESGGTSVLIAGDHTDISGVQRPFNDLMAPLGVHLNYDSAFPLGQWRTQVVHSPHPVNGLRALAPLGAAGDPGVSVGASLTLDWRVAWPVLEAGDGFADAGTPDAPSVAGLGDMQYTNNEPRGGFTLAAERPLGRGTVLAFGDTAFLQNGTLSRNFAYVASVFSYLTRPRPPAQGPELRAAALLAAALTVGALGYRFSVRYAVLCLAVHVAAAAGASTLDDNRRVIGRLDADLLVIDNSHGEMLKPHDTKQGVSVLTDVLDDKAAPLTLECDALDALGTGRVKGVVLLAPRGRFSASDEDRLVDFVANGGRLLYAAGNYESRGHAGWLDRFGCRVTPLVLGAGQQVTLADQTLQRPIGLVEAWGLELAGDWRPALTCYDRPVVATREFGAGRICVLADSFALLDGATSSGSQSTVSADAFVFLTRLLERLELAARP